MPLAHCIPPASGGDRRRRPHQRTRCSCSPSIASSAGAVDDLRLVLLARSDPLLPLHRYRLVGLMRELRGADLAMTRPEIEAVLAAHGVKLLPAGDRHRWRQPPRVGRPVSGCPPCAWKAKARPGDFVSELAIDQGSVGEYLLEEVLADQPEPVRRMLVQTSFLDEVTGPLASAVTGIDRCGEMLDDLAADQLVCRPVGSRAIPASATTSCSGTYSATCCSGTPNLTSSPVPARLGLVRDER